MKNNKPLTTWLFQPFTYIAGSKALIYGLIAMALISVLGYLSETHFDGVLDIHTTCLDQPYQYWVHALYQLVTWVILTIVFYITARIVTKTDIRIVDIAGTMALSQAPLIIAALIGFIPLLHVCLGDVSSLNISELMDIMKENIGPLITIGIIFIICTVWSIILKYNAYSVSANIKGVVGISTFIAALIIAEIISKVLLFIFDITLI